MKDLYLALLLLCARGEWTYIHLPTWASELYLVILEGSTFSSRWTNNKDRQMFTGFWGCYLQTDWENLALSSELPLFPELETNQVSDSIRCGLEVKIVEPKDSARTVQDQLLFPMKLFVCPDQVSYFAFSVRSLIFCNFKMHVIMLRDCYYQHYLFLGKPTAETGTY